MPTDAKDPQHWFDFASQDLIRAHRRFIEADYGDVFHLQQSAEKTLKGKLIASGWKLQRTHDLSALIVAHKGLSTDCSWFEEVAAVLATEYIADRYPGFDEAPLNPAELRTFLAEATKLFEDLSARKYNGPQLAD